MRRLILAFATISLIATGLSTPAPAQLFGLGKFKINQSDDRFSTDGLTTYSGLNNRISKKSVAGGVHIDARGMFVEPIAIKRKSDGILVGLSLFIHNETDFNSGLGSPNGIGAPQKITFLTDSGPPISLTVSKGDRKWADVSSYNSITRSASSRITETGFADITIEQYRRIIESTTLAVKIEGSERSVIYEIKDVSKSFIPNLKAFYDKYLVSKS